MTERATGKERGMGGRCLWPNIQRLMDRDAEVTHLRLMMKTPMKMSSRITLPMTETSSTVELAPSPMIGEGTEGKKQQQSTIQQIITRYSFIRIVTYQ